jgi:hypothetical protein
MLYPNNHPDSRLKLNYVIAIDAFTTLFPPALRNPICICIPLAKWLPHYSLEGQPLRKWDCPSEIGTVGNYDNVFL